MATEAAHIENDTQAGTRRLAALAACLLVAMACALALSSASASAAVESYRNTASINLPGNGSASPYPSTINVPAMEGVVTGVTVAFHGFAHGSAQSVNALLVAPDGKTSLVMTRSCATNVPRTTFVFSDTAPTTMPSYGPCDKFVWRPTENSPDGWVDFGFDAPDGPYSANFNNFLGGSAQGTWKLFIKGYGGARSGKIDGGWTLTLQTANTDAVVPGPGASAGEASSYPLKRAVSGLDGLVTDVNVSVPGVFHEDAADLELMLLGPSGRAAILMSDSCRGDIRYENWSFDDESSAYMSVEQPCASGTYKPVGRSDEIFPAGPPYLPIGTQTALSTFDLTEPNGDWRLYAFDDHPSDDKAGLFLERFGLQIQTRPKAALQFASSTLTVDEGKFGELTLTRSAPGAQLAPASVYLTTTPGSAGAADFRPVPQSVHFEPGETQKKVRVDALADAVRDPGESFSVKVATAFGDVLPTGRTTATVTIRDVTRSAAPPAGGGSTGGGGRGLAPDRTPPRISGLALASTRFTVSRRRATKGTRARRGTTLRISLSEAATLTLRFERLVAGRSSGGRCHPAGAVRRGRPCRRWAAAGTLRRAGRAGTNRVAFSGRIGRRALRPGEHRLVVSAADAAGNRTIARPRTVRVIG